MKSQALKAAALTVAAFGAGLTLGYHNAPEAAEIPPRVILQAPPECFEAFQYEPAGAEYLANRSACLAHANN